MREERTSESTTVSLARENSQFPRFLSIIVACIRVSDGVLNDASILIHVYVGVYYQLVRPFLLRFRCDGVPLAPEIRGGHINISENTTSSVGLVCVPRRLDGCLEMITNPGMSWEVEKYGH